MGGGEARELRDVRNTTPEVLRGGVEVVRENPGQPGQAVRPLQRSRCRLACRFT